jgi:hypothetical protein
MPFRLVARFRTALSKDMHTWSALRRGDEIMVTADFELMEVS